MSPSASTGTPQTCKPSAAKSRRGGPYPGILDRYPITGRREHTRDQIDCLLSPARDDHVVCIHAQAARCGDVVGDCFAQALMTCRLAACFMSDERSGFPCEQTVPGLMRKQALVRTPGAKIESRLAAITRARSATARAPRLLEAVAAASCGARCCEIREA